MLRLCLFLWSLLFMAIRWASSADKHSVPREDVLYAISHAIAQAELKGRSGELTIIYVEHPHGQTER